MPGPGWRKVGNRYAMGKRDMLSNTGLWHRVRVAAHGSFFIGTLALCLSSSAFAASSVTLAWDPSSGTNIAGYKLYYGGSSGTYTNTLTIGNSTNATVSNLVSGATYYFAATAVDTNGLESAYSNEVGYTNVVSAPPAITLTSPANNADYAAPATVSLAASVTANGHTITSVQFYTPTLLGRAPPRPTPLPGAVSPPAAIASPRA